MDRQHGVYQCDKCGTWWSAHLLIDTWCVCCIRDMLIAQGELTTTKPT
jgi:hypothetical protein